VIVDVETAGIFVERVDSIVMANTRYSQVCVFTNGPMINKQDDRTTRTTQQRKVLTEAKMARLFLSTDFML